MKTENYRDLSKAFRKAADVVDKIADNLEDNTIDAKTMEERQDGLLAEFMVQMIKIQNLSNM